MTIMPVTKRGWNGYLRTAVLDQSLRDTERALEHGARPTYANLQYSIFSGDKRVLGLLVEKLDLGTLSEQEQQTLVSQAVTGRHLQMAKVLISKGFDFDRGALMSYLEERLDGIQGGKADMLQRVEDEFEGKISALSQGKVAALRRVEDEAEGQAEGIRDLLNTMGLATDVRL